MNASESNGHGHGGHSMLKTWVIVLLILGIIVFKDSLAIFVVGDLGQPDWDYRPIPGVPAESPYAIYQTLPYPQHVLGAEGE